MYRHQTYLLATVAAGLTAAFAGTALAQSTNLTIFHVNDIYIIDNFPALRTLVDEGNAHADHSLVTVGGDFLSPSVLSGLDQGENMITMFNALGVDYAVFGNHEFDFGPDIAVERIGQSDFPWLGTNVLGADGEPFGGSIALATEQVGDYTVGLFGVLTPDTVELSSTGPNVNITDVVEASEAAIAALQEQGADVIIALTHLDLSDDRMLARTVDGIDVILGGHDHDPMTIYENEVLIHKSGEDGEFLGTLEIAIETVEGRNGPVVEVTPVAWNMVTTAGVEPDAAVQEIVDDFNAMLDDELNVVIGTTDTELVSLRGSVRGEETTMGNLIADAMRAGVGAQIGFTNGGGIRADTTYPPGTELTRRDILSELPFGNVTVLIQMTGAEIREALENGVRQVEDVAGRFPHVSGMTFTFDREAAPGSRVLEILVDGQPINGDEVYTVATNDYSAGGGDGYSVMSGAPRVIDASGATYMATMVMDHISAAGSVAPEIEGRIVESQ